jgi:S1-C subfamily serine protease
MGYLPEVVRIIAAHMDGPTGGKAIGTGFFLAVDGVLIKEEGLLLTNAHVVTNSPVVKIMTTYIEHQALPVSVISICHDRDLALLKVEPRVQQWMKRTLYSRYKLDHIPALTFGNSDTLRTGFKVHAVGHPLGLIDQQFTTGDYQGPVHLNAEIRGLSSATINGGNSGGPLLGTFIQENEQSIEGLHYFVPSRYKLMGVNTFKLTGANVDGENGFIHANTVQTVLPTLLAPLAARHAMELATQSMYSKLKKTGVAIGYPSVAALHDHLDEGAIQLLQQASLHSNWTNYSIGGIVRGQPRNFHSWLMRHVIVPGGEHLQRGGPELLHHVLGFVKEQDWEGLAKYKGTRRWGTIREELVSTSTPEPMPNVVGLFSAAHVHSPQVGITSQPIFTNDILIHYQCPKKEAGRWEASGGVLVTDVQPQSLYHLAGGQEGDIVYRFKNMQVDAELTAGGTWYSKTRDLPLSLKDLCNDTPIGQEMIVSVLRKDQGLLTLTMNNREPTYEELPHVRQTYGFCDEGRFEAKQKVQVQGIQFAPLRLQHVGMFRLLNYMSPQQRYRFCLVVEAVSPESPAYATDAIHAGAVVTHINDEPIQQSWETVVKQLSTPHKDTGCWVIATEYNGMKSKFVMATRQSTIVKTTV